MDSTVPDGDPFQGRKPGHGKAALPRGSDFGEERRSELLVSCRRAGYPAPGYMLPGRSAHRPRVSRPSTGA